MPDGAPTREGTGADGMHPAVVSADADAAAARAAIEAALARHGDTVRAPFWRAVDRCYAAPYRPRPPRNRPANAS